MENDDEMPEWERKALEEQTYNEREQKKPNLPRAVIEAVNREKYATKKIINADDVLNLKIELGLAKTDKEILSIVGCQEFGRNRKREMYYKNTKSLYR